VKLRSRGALNQCGALAQCNMIDTCSFSVPPSAFVLMLVHGVNWTRALQSKLTLQQSLLVQTVCTVRVAGEVCMEGRQKVLTRLARQNSTYPPPLSYAHTP
jgi:uncharacterized membrane protein YjjP (DUF1212 family)